MARRQMNRRNTRAKTKNRNSGLNLNPVNTPNRIKGSGKGPGISGYAPPKHNIQRKRLDPDFTNIESCFIAGTKVTMADDTERNIEDIVIGDRVKGESGINTVDKLDWVKLGPRKLYSFNDENNYFVTSEHPFKATDGWRSINPYNTKIRDGEWLFNQLTGDLDVGTALVTLNGNIEIKSIDSKEIDNPDLQLYNFQLDNDHSYYANGYLVHNITQGLGPNRLACGDGGGYDSYPCNCHFSCFHCTPPETCIPYANQASCCVGACASLTESECDSSYEPLC